MGTPKRTATWSNHDRFDAIIGWVLNLFANVAILAKLTELLIIVDFMHSLFIEEDIIVI